MLWVSLKISRSWKLFSTHIIFMNNRNTLIHTLMWISVNLARHKGKFIARSAPNDFPRFHAFKIAQHSFCKHKGLQTQDVVCEASVLRFHPNSRKFWGNPIGIATRDILIREQGIHVSFLISSDSSCFGIVKIAHWQKWTHIAFARCRAVLLGPTDDCLTTTDYYLRCLQINAAVFSSISFKFCK